MPSPPTTQLPRPSDWNEFEDLVADVLRERWKTPNVTRNGRSGQEQAGVDIYASAHHLPLGEYAGAQCKKTDALTTATLHECVRRAEDFVPALAELLICTTAPRDAKVQQEARLLDQQNARAGRFRVVVLFWEDLSLELSGYPRLLAKHFPNWAKLSHRDEEPQLSLHWLSEEEGDVVTLNAVPRQLLDLRAVARPFSEEELTAPEVTPEEVVLARDYNAKLEAVLADPDNPARWVRQHARERHKEHGVAVGLRLENERAPARDVLVTLSFPEGFEVWAAGEVPKEAEVVALPKRPAVGKAARLLRRVAPAYSFPGFNFPDYSLRTDNKRFTAALRLSQARMHRRLFVESGEATIRLESISPRRTLSFSGDDGLTVVPPSVRGDYEVPWEADAENLTQPCRGVLKLRVV